MQNKRARKVTIGIPHWQVKPLLAPCLRAIRKHSRAHDVKVIVVDNGSKDESLDYLRGLKWVQLIERPFESPANFPGNVFSAWDEAIKHCDGEFFITMHTDVFIKSDKWLDAFFKRFDNAPHDVAAVGAWKLTLESPFYAWQKQFFQNFGKRIRGKPLRDVVKLHGKFPRDYCAMYRARAILENDLSFSRGCGVGFGGGLYIWRQLREKGYAHKMIPTTEMAKYMVHIDHGSSAFAEELQLHRAQKTFARRQSQRKVERRARELFNETWVRELINDAELDK